MSRTGVRWLCRCPPGTWAADHSCTPVAVPSVPSGAILWSIQDHSWPGREPSAGSRQPSSFQSAVGGMAAPLAASETTWQQTSLECWICMKLERSVKAARLQRKMCIQRTEFVKQRWFGFRVSYWSSETSLGSKTGQLGFYLFIYVYLTHT